MTAIGFNGFTRPVPDKRYQAGFPEGYVLQPLLSASVTPTSSNVITINGAGCIHGIGITTSASISRQIQVLWDGNTSAVQSFSSTTGYQYFYLLKLDPTFNLTTQDNVPDLNMFFSKSVSILASTGSGVSGSIRVLYSLAKPGSKKYSTSVIESSFGAGIDGIQVSGKGFLNMVYDTSGGSTSTLKIDDAIYTPVNLYYKSLPSVIYGNSGTSIPTVSMVPFNKGVVVTGVSATSTTKTAICTLEVIG